MQFEDRVRNIETTEHVTTALFLTEDEAEVNMYRRAVLSEIETYAIDIVTFHINTSPREDEVLALRLGQVVIDNNKFVPPEEGNFTSRIDFSGPGYFTTQHIPGLEFMYVTPIVKLREGQRILCDIIVKKGQAKEHVKWRPISTFVFNESPDGYLIKINDIGMLPGPVILERGYKKIKDAAQRPPITIFSRPLIPNNIVF